MVIPNFLLVQFNEGAAGKFLLTLLMGSPSVAHFDQLVEQQKTNKELINYVQQSFNSFDAWLATEPNPVLAWNIHWISNKLDRGSSQTQTEFNTQLHLEASDYFWQSVKNHKRILIVSNKTSLPLPYQNLNPVVIINDSPGLKFLRKARWVKHYKVENNKIYLKINDPKMYPEPTRSIMKKFNNPLYTDESVYKFYRRVIWQAPATDFFSNQANFPKNSNFIKLSEILDIDQLIISIDQLCSKLGIKDIDHSYIRQAHAHWIKLHTFRF
jgi:hypothetical protein